MMNNDGLRQIRCSQCGRFMGLGILTEGEIYLWCKRCKVWTVILGAEAERNLTGKEMYDKLSTSGSKARKG